MAREFGVRSYKPEEVNFSATGSQPSGLPWSAVKRKLPKNILLEANNNPSTIEELSVELGIAAPYMEEEVDILVNSELLKKLDNGKYVTDFFIASKECQLDVYNTQKNYIKTIADSLGTIISDSIEDIKSLNIMRNDRYDGNFKWLLTMLAADYLISSRDNYTEIMSIYQRKDKGNWGFMGSEKHNYITEPLVSVHNGTWSDTGEFWSYNPSIGNPLGYWQAVLITDIIKNNRKINTLTEKELEIFKHVDGILIQITDDSTMIPQFAVFENDTYDKMIEIFKSHPLYKNAIDAMNQVAGKITDILKENSNSVLHEHIDFYVSMFMFDTRMMILNYSIETDELEAVDYNEKNTLGMYLTIK